jgi:hypothetical protein
MVMARSSPGKFRREIEMLTLIQVGEQIFILNNVKSFDHTHPGVVTVEMLDKSSLEFYGREAARLWERLVNTCTITIK